MTNKEIIDKVTATKYPCICISKEMDSFIKENYTKGNSEGRFYKVYKEGNDTKYGHYMINPITMKWRSSTFNEFYGGGVVD